MTKLCILEMNNEDRLRLFNVFFVALPVIALEIVAFQTLNFVNDYMAATQVISIALLGISVGGLMSYFVPRHKADRAGLVALFLLPSVIMASFPVIIRLNYNPILMMGLLTAPYIVASFYISLSFNIQHPGHVYLFDLMGAGFGAVVAVLSVPLLREEGSFFLVGLLASIPLLISVFNRTRRRSSLTQIGAVLSTLLPLGLLIAHMAADPFNMIWNAKTEDNDFAGKVFNHMKGPNGEKNWELLYSRGSLVERIDIIKGVGVENRLESVYNGRRVDALFPNPSTLGVLDYRLPTRLRLGQNPSTLLVGPSGQGLCKAVQGLGDGHVDAVEINGAIAGLMTDELVEASGDAYGGFNLTVGDVRTFIERTTNRYDFITMLNTHRIWSMGHLGAPEYIHTIEAMRTFVDHLTDDGFLVLEERNINDQADLGIRRLLHTAKTALRESGVEDPSKHIVIWERYHSCPKKRMLADPPKCDRIFLFTFIAIKKTPVTDEEYHHLIEWEKTLSELPHGKTYAGFLWRYLPQQPTAGYWTDVVMKDDLYETPGADRNLHNLEIVTDDKPFPFDIFLTRDAAWNALKNVSLLAILMVLLPTIIAFFSLRKKSDAQLKASNRIGMNSLLVLYFCLLGVAYLIVEVVLIQKLGVFLSSPVWSMAVVLSAMLVFSGIGGYAFRDASFKNGIYVFGGVVAIGLILWSALDPILSVLMPLPFILRIVAAIVLVGPISFMMGVPFPYGVGLAKRALSERHAGLFFGINGAFGATASPLTIILSMAVGFRATFLIGVGLYFVCGLLLAAAGALARKTV